MDDSYHDATPASVRRAMLELEQRSRLLHEERDYYTSLFSSAQRAYDEHRRELTMLLEKERRAHAEREDALQEELAALQRGVGELVADVERHRGRSVAMAQAELERFQRESLDAEARLRAELDAAHRRLLDERRRLGEAREELHTTTAGCLEASRRQDALKIRVQKLTEETYLRNALAFNDEEPAPPRSKAVRVVVPFIPSGGASKRGGAEPVTHNAHALVQTARKASYRSPPRVRLPDVNDADDPTAHCEREESHQRRSASADAGARFRREGSSHSAGGGPADRSHHHLHGLDTAQLRTMRQSLQDDLEDLREEYDRISHALGDPRHASAGVSRRLRELFDGIEHKTAQLDAVQAAANRMEAAFRLNRMIDESFRRNEECQAIHASLMQTIHSKST